MAADDTISPPEGFVVDKPPGQPAAPEAQAKPAAKPEVPAPPAGFVMDASAEKPQIGPVSEQMRAKIAGPLGRKVASTVRQTASQMDSDVDYSGVAAPGLRAQYGFLDTPEERKQFLAGHFGKENVAQDSFGRDVVVMNGQKVAFLPRGGKDTGKKGANAAGYADLAGDVAPVAGMVLGSLATAPFPGAGIVGAGVGGAGGKGINKLIKETMGPAYTAGGGYNLQSTPEIAKDIAMEVPVGMAGQGAAEAIGIVGRSILRGPFREGSIFGPITEKGKELFAKVQKEVEAARAIGLKPKVGTYSPNASFTQRVQNAGFRLFGDDLTLKNRPIIEEQAAKLTGGYFKNEAERAEAVNRLISSRADQTVKTAQAVADAAKVEAETLLRGAESSITGRVGEPSGELAAMAAKDVLSLKKEWAAKMSEGYAPVDALAGKPVVPYSGIKTMMKQILEEMPQTAKGEPAFVAPELKNFAKEIFSLPEYGTFQQMQVIRSTLRDYADVQALNAGLTERQAARLGMAANDSFEYAKSELITKFTSQPPQQLKEFKAKGLLQTLREKGGVALDQIRDLTGEARVGAGVKGLQPGLFRKDGKPLGDLATELREEGWAIADDKVDGGVQALRDKIQKELAGEKQFSVADTDRKAVWDLENRLREDAAAEKPFVTTTRVVIPGVEEAKAALRNTDKLYAEGIQKFNDLTVKAMVKEAGQTGFIEPELFASRVAMPGQNDKLLRVKEVVSPATFGEIGAVKWKQMLDTSKDPLTGQVSGKILARQLGKMGSVLETLYGKAEAGRMVSYAEHLAALNGSMDASALKPGRLAEAVRDAVMKKEASDAVMSRGFIKALQTDGPQSLSAVQWLTEPEHRLPLRQTIDVFGPKSAEAGNIKEYLARRIFTSMEVPATRGAEKYGSTELMGEPLLNELNRYGKPYLTEVFGKGWTDSAYQFAKNVEVATRKNPTDSGGLIAASLGLHWLRHIGEIAKYFTAGELLSTEPVITYLSRGFGKGGWDFMQKALGTGLKVGAAYEAEEITKQGADYTRGAVTHAQGQQSPFGSMLQSTGAKQ